MNLRLHKRIRGSDKGFKITKGQIDEKSFVIFQSSFHYKLKLKREFKISYSNFNIEIKKRVCYEKGRN